MIASPSSFSTTDLLVPPRDAELIKNVTQKYLAVHIVPDQLMMFGGKGDPCALCSLHSIGKIEGAQKQYSKLLCGLLNKHLGISPDRIYVNFFDMEAANVAWNNSTFG
ncbi:macrophage migration inhibitory factor isoform X1 [Salmo salar]|uniref:Macrophage migration inhibitory factor n=1 Tax=Salmo salar TaxID=8030 RepID=A0A1S3RSQ6_SALSA|nr:macrophage migration inhibitory factor isoform X1 [Salmo salar]|eukprot:XP_014055340.1 PREDICTED: macrophage migration inhibitory factor isoform X1 [Salmo salar]